jgi:chromate transporter
MTGMKLKEAVGIFGVFAKMGCMTFGGGYAMLPVVERELITKRGWLTIDEVMDYYTIAQATPGVIAVNMSTFAGCKRMGAAGGVLATLGFVSIPLVLMIAVGMFIAGFAHIEAVGHAFAGIRIAVGALILDTIIKMGKGAFSGIYSVIICVVSFCLSVIFSANPVVLVVAFALCGYLLYSPRGSGHRERT